MAQPSETNADEPGIQEDVPEEDGGRHVCLSIKRLLPTRRIDKYLRHRFPDFSRNIIQGLIQEQAVTVNGRAVKCSYQLKPGDDVDIMLPPPPTNEIVPEEIPLDIVYEDEYMLAINKQADLIVHPARGNRSGTLVNGLVHYSDSLSKVNGDFRPGIVHRLDRNTTGIIIVAKTDTAHWRLAHQFEHRLTRKVYTAVVHGTMDLDADQIDVPLGRHPRVREKYAARLDIGKEAVTRYELLKQYRGYALVKLMPKTGRTHQLRVHMSIIKHPIVSDTMYGGKSMTFAQLEQDQPLTKKVPSAFLASRSALPIDQSASSTDQPVSPIDQTEPAGDSTAAVFLPGNSTAIDSKEKVISRQALHAAELYIRHPISGKELSLKAPLPNDMQLLIDMLERYRTQAK